jgi:hypothetical protein
VAGALSLSAGIFGLAFAGDDPTLWLGGAFAIGMRLVTAAVMALAGLWMRDGRRAGALLALPIDVLCVLLALIAPVGSLLDLAVAVALLGSVLWVLPTLGAARAR